MSRTLKLKPPLSSIEFLRLSSALGRVRLRWLGFGSLPFRPRLVCPNPAFRSFFCALHLPRFSARPFRIRDHWVSFFAPYVL